MSDDEQRILAAFRTPSPLSVTTIAKRTRLTRKRINFLITNYLSKTLKRVDPLTVGSGKRSLRVYGIDDGGTSEKVLEEVVVV